MNIGAACILSRMDSDCWACVFLRVNWLARAKFRLVCRDWAAILDNGRLWLDVDTGMGPMLLRSACERGRLAAAQWLVATFGLTADDARARDNWALRWSCEKGHLAVTQWLVETFGLTAADARADCNWAMCWSCANGHLLVAQWLVSTFGLTATDARADSNRALRWSCANGHLVVVQWLMATFGLEPHCERCRPP